MNNNYKKEPSVWMALFNIMLKSWVRLIFVLLLIIPNYNALKAQALHLGIHAGITYNMSALDLTDRTSESSNSLPGLYVSIPFICQISKQVNFNTGAGIVFKNRQVYRTRLYSGVYENSINNYLQIPIIFNGKVWELNKFKFLVGTGFFFSYWLSSKLQGKIPNIYNSEINLNNGQSELLLSLANYSEPVNLKKDEFNRFEIGGLLSSTIQYNYSEKYSLIFDVNYCKSFTGQQQKSLGKKQEYNRTLIFSVGIMRGI